MIDDKSSQLKQKRENGSYEWKLDKLKELAQRIKRNEQEAGTGEEENNCKNNAVDIK